MELPMSSPDLPEGRREHEIGTTTLNAIRAVAQAVRDTDRAAPGINHHGAGFLPGPAADYRQAESERPRRFW
jgi:hypothetical protein